MSSLKEKFLYVTDRMAEWYFVPLTLKKGVVALAIQQTLSYTSGSLLYPDMEEHLVSLGFSETVAADIALKLPHFIRPVANESNWIDHAQSAVNLPTLIGTVAGMAASLQLSEDLESTNMGYSLSAGICVIGVPSPDNPFLKEGLGQYIGVNAQSITGLDLTKQELAAFISLHEQGHCLPGNSIINIAMLISNAANFIEPFKLAKIKFEMEKEWRSDLTALTHLHSINPDEPPQKYKYFQLYFRASAPHHVFLDDLDEAHDLTLQVDAKIHGTDFPTFEDIMNSRAELSEKLRSLNRSDFIGNIDEKFLSERYIITNARMIQHVLEENTFSNSFAKRRAILHLEALHYFVPELIEYALGLDAQKYAPYRQITPPSPL